MCGRGVSACRTHFEYLYMGRGTRGVEKDRPYGGVWDDFCSFARSTGCLVACTIEA
jgi:hypothetical protein